MAAKKVGGKWFVKKKSGKLGTRAYNTEAAANAAQRRGRNLLSGAARGSGGGSSSGSSSNNNKKLTQGKGLAAYAISGSIIDRFGRYAVDQNEDYLYGILEDYAAINVKAGTMSWDHLVRGYGGSAVEAGYRKFAKAFGYKPYPRMEIKNFSDLILNFAMHGSPGIQVWTNRGDLGNAHREAYKRYFGIDLNSWGGLDAVDLGYILETKGAYTVTKWILKSLKELGIDVNAPFRKS